MSVNPWEPEGLQFFERYITFKVPSGRDVWVRSFSYSSTYAGLLEGFPDKSYNDDRVERCRSERRFPNDPLPLVIRPVSRKGLRGGVWMPPICCRAELYSVPPVDPDMHFSVLTVIWFCTPFFDARLRDVIKAAISNIDWERHATDVCL